MQPTYKLFFFDSFEQQVIIRHPRKFLLKFSLLFIPVPVKFYPVHFFILLVKKFSLHKGGSLNFIKCYIIERKTYMNPTLQQLKSPGGSLAGGPGRDRKTLGKQISSAQHFSSYRLTVNNSGAIF